jgi:ubiquinone biosynthesis protein Coq4
MKASRETEQKLRYRRHRSTNRPPGVKAMLQKIKFFYHLLKFAKDPTNTAEVFEFTESLVAGSGKADRERFGRIMLEDARAQALYTATGGDVTGPLFTKPYKLEELVAYPAGTLGHEYAQTMMVGGYDPEFFKYNQVDDIASFFTLRVRKTHDIYHVLTGFGTDVPGEIGLQGFYLGQLHLPVPMSITVGAMLWVIQKRDPAIIRDAMEQLVYGYQAGRRAQKLHGVVWEDLWGRDLESLRQELGIKPFTAAARAA